MLITATTQTVPGPVYTLTGSDDLKVGAGVTIRSTWFDLASHTGADAVLAWTGTHSITVDGTIIGEDEAINLIGCTTAQRVSVSATGRLIAGGDGVVANADGVILDGAGSALVNAGLIRAYGSAAMIAAYDGPATTITNSGTMIGRVAGVWHQYGTGTVELTNTGTIRGTAHAYLGNGGTDRIINAGVMVGAVDLGGGNDLLDTRTGRLDGSVLGGEGDDTFVPGSFADRFDGGAGFDTLDLSAFAVALTVNLADGSQNLGAPVRTDTYTGIERIIGGAANDGLAGNAADNHLLGGGGRDRLAGADGADRLDGGLLADRLTGGAGADSFVFAAPVHGGDVITDFAVAEDRIILNAAAFGMAGQTGALAAGVFIQSAGNAALDGNDHFIFRTGDATLWFDADGAGGAASVLVANLNDGILLTAGHLLLE